MRAIKILLISSLLFSANLFAQEAETAPAPTNLDKLLELVKEGRTKEQSYNDNREAEFKASRDKQNEILKAEQRELARQERIADQLEEEFRKNPDDTHRVFYVGVTRAKENLYLVEPQDLAKSYDLI